MWRRTVCRRIKGRARNGRDDARREPAHHLRMDVSQKRSRASNLRRRESQAGSEILYFLMLRQPTPSSCHNSWGSTATRNIIHVMYINFSFLSHSAAPNGKTNSSGSRTDASLFGFFPFAATGGERKSENHRAKADHMKYSTRQIMCVATWRSRFYATHNRATDRGEIYPGKKWAANEAARLCNELKLRRSCMKGRAHFMSTEA